MGVDGRKEAEFAENVYARCLLTIGVGVMERFIRLNAGKVQLSPFKNTLGCCRVGYFTRLLLHRKRRVFSYGKIGLPFREILDICSNRVL